MIPVEKKGTARQMDKVKNPHWSALGGGDYDSALALHRETQRGSASSPASLAAASKLVSEGTELFGVIDKVGGGRPRDAEPAGVTDSDGVSSVALSAKRVMLEHTSIAPEERKAMADDAQKGAKMDDDGRQEGYQAALNEGRGSTNRGDVDDAPEQKPGVDVDGHEKALNPGFWPDPASKRNRGGGVREANRNLRRVHRKKHKKDPDPNAPDAPVDPTAPTASVYEPLYDLLNVLEDTGALEHLVVPPPPPSVLPPSVLPPSMDDASTLTSSSSSSRPRGRAFSTSNRSFTSSATVQQMRSWAVSLVTAPAPPTPLPRPTPLLRRPVIVLDKDSAVPLRYYASIKDAGSRLGLAGLNSISCVCQQKRRSYKGFGWRFATPTETEQGRVKSEVSEELLMRKIEQHVPEAVLTDNPVMLVNKDTGVAMRYYTTIKDAAARLNLDNTNSIVCVCQGKRGSYSGLGWRWATALEQETGRIPKPVAERELKRRVKSFLSKPLLIDKPVIVMNRFTHVPLKLYDSVREVAGNLDIDSCHIVKVCQDKESWCKGFGWRWATPDEIERGTVDYELSEEELKRIMWERVQEMLPKPTRVGAHATRNSNKTCTPLSHPWTQP